MLQSLMVKNFAIIDNICIDFDSGFTAITGETGAGKSLLIDAISLLLGERASSSMIKTGENKAVIEGVFTDLGRQTKAILEEFDLFEDEETLIIKREIHSNGKSVVRVNGAAVTISQLEELAKTLADIHTQNDTKKLFDSKNYLLFIDDSLTFDILKKYQDARSEYIKAIKNYNEIIENIDELKKEKEYLEYVYQTLNNASLKVGELEMLEEEVKVMNNYEAIYKNLSVIKNDFRENNITDTLYSIKSSLEKLSDLDPKYRTQASIVENAYYDLVDIDSTISQNFTNLEFDSDLYNSLCERINYLKDLKYKYKMSINELIEYRDDLENKLNLIDDDKVLIEDAEKLVNKTYDDCINLASKLSNARKNNAIELENNIKESLKDLMLEKVRIKIEFSSNLKDIKTVNTFAKNGIDVVNIMISFNPGEELKELAKVASGGEMSRVMLAIKTHLLKNLELATMIFDEIDSGISGEVAFEVAKKLKSISKHTQVLSITHLPVVAAIANSHLHITKKYDNDTTLTSVDKLLKEERINVLAKMISPNDVNKTSLEIAENMLKIS